MSNHVSKDELENVINLLQKAGEDDLARTLEQLGEALAAGANVNRLSRIMLGDKDS